MKAVGFKIISGGQTGADRAALDFALAHGIPHGGWCPLGWLAEDGQIDPRYHLQATPNANYIQRTEWNVRDADGTVIFSLGAELQGGSRLTAEFASQQRKPWLHLSKLGGPPNPALALQHFLAKHRIRVLNVAGPRASQEPDIAAFVMEVLKKALTTGTVAAPACRTKRKSC